MECRLTVAGRSYEQTPFLRRGAEVIGGFQLEFPALAAYIEEPKNGEGTMGEFPYGFEYETLMTDKDRTLRKLALTLYSEDAADRIAQKYMLASTNPNQNLDDNWTDYERRVWELISRE